VTFLEAFERFGRDSMAIAEACGISEAHAYNLYSRRADFDHSPVDAARAIRQEYNLRKREKLRAVREQHRVGA